MNHQFKIFSFIIAFSIAAHGATADAATLSVTPGSASVNQGSTFSVTVRTNTEGASVNVTEATVTYPTDMLEVVSATPGTTFPLQTPGSPKKSAGQVFFSGGIPSGYSGANGIVGKITFRAKGSGSATISLASGRVLLNDGNATDALRGMNGSSITIKQTSVAEPVTPAEETPPAETPAVPIEPTEVVTEVVPQTEVAPTTIIRTEDLIRLIYVLVGMIVFLLVVIIVLVILLIRRHATHTTHTKTPRKPKATAEPVSVTEVPKLSRTPRKSRSVEPI